MAFALTTSIHGSQNVSQQAVWGMSVGTDPPQRAITGSSAAGELAVIGRGMAERFETIADNMAAAVRAKISYYQHDYSPTRDSVLASCQANLRFVLGGLDPVRNQDITGATKTGEERAQGGVPVHGLVSAHRVSAYEIWQALHSTMNVHTELSRKALLAAAEQVEMTQHFYVETGAEAHCRRSRLHAADTEEERSELVEGLLLGRGSFGLTAWEVAELLHVPPRGPFVVVAIRRLAKADRTPTDIEQRLRILDIHSAWRNSPGLRLGIVGVASADTRSRLLDALHRWLAGGVGVSPEFTDLSDIPTAARYARTAAARATLREPVVVVSNAALEIAALVDPHISRRLAASTLGAFQDLPACERDVLRHTFITWTSERGSIQRTAEALFCHPNTVRYRIQRIEQLTGRSVRAPIELAELCLAFEIVTKLPPSI